MKRTVYVFNNGWSIIAFEKLKKGQLFKMFEVNGNPVIDKNGKDRWVAANNANFNYIDGVYVIDVVPYTRLVKG